MTINIPIKTEERKNETSHVSSKYFRKLFAKYIKQYNKFSFISFSECCVVRDINLRQTRVMSLKYEMFEVN